MKYRQDSLSRDKSFITKFSRLHHISHKIWKCKAFQKEAEVVNACERLFFSMSFACTID